MNTFIRAADFDDWLKTLTDQIATARVLARLRSAMLGNFGDCGGVGDGVSEMRIHDADPCRPRLPRLFRQDGVDCLCAARRRRQVDAETGHPSGKGAGKRTERQNEMTTYATFDVADYLDNDEVVAEYLSAAMEDPDPAVFLAALSDVAKARGVGKIADDTGLEPEGSDTIPRVAPSREAVNGLLRALGMRLVVVADRGPS